MTPVQPQPVEGSEHPRTRALPWALLVGCISCGAATCPQIPVQLPSAPSALPWTDGGSTRVSSVIADAGVALVLDTGSDQTSLNATDLAAVGTSTASIALGPVSAGPLALGVLTAPGAESLLGGDVLHELPLIFDALKRETDVIAGFSSPASDAIPLQLICRNHSVALLVPANLDGQNLTLVLDTGAQATFVRNSVVSALSARPTLEGIPVDSAFAGPFPATATRARALTVGGATSSDSLLLAAPEVDSALDALGARLGKTPDGYLGWTFLREFQVSLAGATGPESGRTIELTRFPTQSHWTREFVGIGIDTSTSTAPAGLAVQGFLPGSPAQAAGLQLGDVIVTVNGTPALQAPNPFAPVGTAVALGVDRGGQSLTFSVTVEDLLPNPP